MKSTIITGANGFLGSHLTKKLNNFIAIPHDEIHNFELPQFDYAFFLSSYGNLSTQTDIGKTIIANVLDLTSILSKIDYTKPFKSFVFVSTSSVKLKRQTAYSRTKRAAQEILLAFKEKYNLPIAIVQPYTCYGTRDNPIHLIPTILRSIFKGEEMNFAPTPTHDYVCASDVVDGLLSLSNHGSKGIFEIGSGVKTSNQEILELLEDITGKKAKVNYVSSLRDFDNDNWVSDSYKWIPGGSPKVKLKDGLKEVVDDYVKHPEVYAVKG